MGKASRRKWEKRAKWPAHKQDNLKASKFIKHLLKILGTKSVLLGVDRVSYVMHRAPVKGPTDAVVA